MPCKLKIEIIESENVLEIYEKEPGKLTFAMYPDDPKNETYLELVTRYRSVLGTTQTVA